jgi:hypothetical protein
VLVQIAIGAGLLVFTVSIHAAFTVAAIHIFGRGRTHHWERHFARTVAVSALVLLMFFATLLETLAWAVTYRVVGALPDLESALYFSTVTYTTLGYGDITLGEWRLLSALQGANGCIAFGWTTALVVALLHSFFDRR